MKNLVKIIKENKLYIISICIAILLLIIQMKQVVLYADDFSLGIISSKGIKECFSYFFNNYLNWGGGLTCLIATIFLMFRIGIWKIFVITIIISFFMLTIKMINKKSDKEKTLLFILGISCFFSLNIWIGREVIYWLDGSLAYLLTAFQLFLYFYYCYTRISLKKKKKYDNVLYPLIAFFAGWSSAQSGPAAIIVPILIIFFEIKIKKENLKKIEKINYICIFLCLIGFCIFYFAPGNNARMIEKFPEFANYNIFEKILYRSEAIYGLIFDIKRYQYTGIPFYLLICIGFINSLFYTNCKNSKLRFLSIPIFIYLFLCLVDKINVFSSFNLSKYLYEYTNLLDKKDALSFITICPYMVGTIIIILSIVEAFMIANKKNNSLIAISLIIAYFTQFIMFMAPYSPLRTTFYTIMFLWTCILFLVNENMHENFNTTVVTIIAFSLYDIKLSLLIILLIMIMKENNQKNYIILIIMMVILATYNYVDITKNYGLNKKIYEENILRINTYKSTSDNKKELKILLPYNDIYGFTPMVGYDWVERDIKKYFNLPTDLKLIGVKERTNE